MDDIETWNDPVLRRKRTYQREILPYLNAGFVFTAERLYGDYSDEDDDNDKIQGGNSNSNGNKPSSGASSLFAAKNMVSSAFGSLVKAATVSVLDNIGKGSGSTSGGENVNARGEMVMVTMDESLPPKLSWITLKNEQNVPKAKGSIPLRLIQVVAVQEGGSKICMKTHTGEVLFLVKVGDVEEGKRFANFVEEALVVRAPEIEDDSQSLKGGYQKKERYAQLQSKIKANEKKKADMGLTGIGMGNVAKIMASRGTNDEL